MADLNKMVELLLTEMAQENSDVILDMTYPIIKKKLIEEFGFVPQVHEIRTPKTEKILKGIVHEKFQDVLQAVSLDLPVYLTGKAGTGKNFICQQVAEALELEFYFTNAVSQEYKLTGFIDANGNYQETQFYKAFTQGGLFFLDEMDASIPEVLVILNAAIANRYFDFPNGKVNAHPDFRVIAAGNTTGLGADNIYTGRYQLDRASLDRFLQIEIDYSPAIDEAMAHGDKELVEFCHAFRKATDKLGIQCLFTYRSLDRIATLDEVMDDLPAIMKMSLTKGLCKEDVDSITYRLEDDFDHNRYFLALLGENVPKRQPMPETSPREEADGWGPDNPFD